MLELGDARRQLGDLHILCGNLRRQRQEHSDDSLAPLLEDCLCSLRSMPKGFEAHEWGPAYISPRSSLQCPQVDQLNAYQIPGVRGGFRS